MSTAEFGDLNLGQAPEPAPDALTPLTLTPPAPVEQPAQPVAPPVEAQTAPIPVSDMRDVPLGTLIFREGLLTEEQLEEALQDGMQRGKRLGEVLLERGLVSENDLGRLLAGQKGLQFVQLDSAAIDPAAVRLLSVEKARLHTVLPIGFQEGLPVVAVADPSNDLVIENVRRALNCEPRLVVAGREALNRQIEQAYATAAPVVSEPSARTVDRRGRARGPVVSQPAAPVAVEPVALEPLAVEPLAVEPVAVEPVTEPLAPQAPVAQPAPVSGEGLWLGAEPVVQPEAGRPVGAGLPAGARRGERTRSARRPAACPRARCDLLRARRGSGASGRTGAGLHAGACRRDAGSRRGAAGGGRSPRPGTSSCASPTASDRRRLLRLARRRAASGVVGDLGTERLAVLRRPVLRPEAIVSVDLVAPEGGWLGPGTSPRLADGERIDVGSFAQSLTALSERRRRAQSRHAAGVRRPVLRPEAIVSVDLVGGRGQAGPPRARRGMGFAHSSTAPREGSELRAEAARSQTRSPGFIGSLKVVRLSAKAKAKRSGVRACARDAGAVPSVPRADGDRPEASRKWVLARQQPVSDRDLPTPGDAKLLP